MINATILEINSRCSEQDVELLIYRLKDQGIPLTEAIGITSRECRARIRIDYPSGEYVIAENGEFCR